MKSMSSTRFAAILFADIAGSTSLYETSGDAVAMTAVTRCLDTLKQIARTYQGEVIKTIGDEVMCIFAAVDDAIRAANEMQAKVEGDKVLHLKIRVGVHAGSVMTADGDVYGDTVNLAARLVQLANPGQILTSGQVFDSLSAYLQVTCRRLYATSVKGRNEKVTIFEALWQQDDGMTIVTSAHAVAALPASRLLLVHREQTWTVSEEANALTVGRDASNDVAIDIPTASRQHLRIEFRKGRIVLVDRSSNGSFITLGTGENIVLRREEFVLTGSGRIGLGCLAADCGEDALGFEIWC